METNPQTVVNEFKVGHDQSNMRIDQLLFDLYPVISREEWKVRIQKYLVHLNGNRIKPAKKVKCGDLIQFEYNKKAEPDVNTNYKILYGINPIHDIIAIDKPADLPVHPAGVYFKNTLTSLLKQQRGQNFPVYLVNRLDRETSGIVLIARSAQSCKVIQQQFFEHSVQKEYLVFVEGSFPVYLDASGYIGRCQDSKIKKKMAFYKGLAKPELQQDWKECRTEFFCLQSAKINGKMISYIKVKLHSGRTHQIRATLCSLGYPVIGDSLYGVDENLYLKFIDDTLTSQDREKLRIERTALHCSRIVFNDPQSNSRVEISCDLPDDLLALLATMDRNNQ